MNPHTRNAKILKIYRAYNRPLVDREVMEEMGSHDPNVARPRITELIKKGLLKQTGKREDGITHRKVRTVTVAGPRETGDLFGN